MNNKSLRKNTATVLTLALLITAVSGPGSTDATAKTKPFLNHKSLTMNTGETSSLTVSGISSRIKTKWQIADKSIVKKVSSSKNKIKLKALKAGKTKVKATVKKKTLTCKVSVLSNDNSSDFDDFARKAAELIKNHEVQSSSAIAAADPFYTGRLIAKGKSAKNDFSKYSPQAVLKSDDNIYILQFDTSDSAKKAFQQISNNENIEWVEPDAYIGTDTEPSSEEISATKSVLSWGVSMLGADSYAAKSSKEELTVAVVDTGVSSHTFLNGRIVSGIDYIDNDDNPADLNSHGTHVAGTIVDCTPGLNVKIMPVRVLNANGNGNTSTIAMGIRYAVDHGAKVINLSLGGGHSSYTDTYIQYALSKGVTVVAAAGNSYSNTSSFCPAHMNDIIVVGAIDEYKNKADFSNYGNSVDVVAPGVNIVSCIPGGSYASYSGTSMAAPHISACAAMVLVNYPGCTPSQVESTLRSCAHDLGSAGWDMYFGAGIPDMNNITAPVVVPTATPVATKTPTQKPVATKTPTQKPVATKTPVPISTATSAPIFTFAPIPTRTPAYTTAPVPTRTPARTYAPAPTAPVFTTTPIASPDPSGVIHDPSGYYYRVRNNLTAMITDYDGAGGNITIPDYLGGYPVQYISDGAFRNNTTIRNLTITGTFDISNEAFAGCSNLRSITVTAIVNSVGSRAFGNCTSLSSISITGMMFNSASDAFSDCTALKLADITGIIDNSVKSAIAAAPGRPTINMIGLVT